MNSRGQGHGEWGRKGSQGKWGEGLLVKPLRSCYRVLGKLDAVPGFTSSCPTHQGAGSSKGCRDTRACVFIPPTAVQMVSEPTLAVCFPIGKKCFKKLFCLESKTCDVLEVTGWATLQVHRALPHTSWSVRLECSFFQVAALQGTSSGHLSWPTRIERTARHCVAGFCRASRSPGPSLGLPSCAHELFMSTQTP